MIPIGAKYLGHGQCEFSLWGPLLNEAAVRIVAPAARLIPMKKDERGYWQVKADDLAPGMLYFYRINGKTDRPDPAANFQPQGVFGPSQIEDHGSFPWDDQNYSGVPLEEMIIYELHTGTFSPEGTFEGVGKKLKDLNELGINCLELMPVAQFSGARNWGYDGVYLFSVQNSYGGPGELKKLVNACHKQNIGVILDVVYNHLGPEGNYLADFGPYFTEKYITPWGQAINFDDPYSDEVKNFFIQNALYWFEHFHFDALRLDAIHGIYDMSAKHFLRELSEKTEEYSRRKGKTVYLIAESDLNDVKIITPRDQGGYGLNAQWSDEFHHAVHTLLTGETQGYYQDFGGIGHLLKAFQEGFVYSGEYSVFRKRHHGNSSKNAAAAQFVAFSQNHDQIGNRLQGERLSSLVSFEALKLAAGTVFLSSYIPLLFMGEEYGEKSPFLFFVDYTDPGLISAVREGRKREFASFCWPGEPSDPLDLKTFTTSKLQWENRNQGSQAVLLSFYRELIQLRKSIPALSCLSKKETEVIQADSNSKTILLKKRYQESRIVAILNYEPSEVTLNLKIEPGKWLKLLDSAEEKWHGPGTKLPGSLQEQTQQFILQPFSFCLYQKEE